MGQIINPEDIQLIYIDLFCGAGGTTTGVHNARMNGKICALVAACINHDNNAIRSHKSNHKQTLHFTEDITELYKTRRWDKLRAHIAFMRVQYQNAKIVLWASLECTNFSRAKGGLPRDADSRTLAEHLFPYIELINPDYIQIENVEEFMSWGDLDINGKPVSKTKGKDYVRWMKQVCSYGYESDFRILNSADFGAYTSRKRLFIQFGKYDLPIVWPEPTYCKGGSTGMFAFKKWKPVKDVLDFFDEGISIFLRKKTLSEKTLERIYAGLIRFIAGGMNKFISSYYGNGSNCSSIDQPCPTLTTKDRCALVNPCFIDQQFGQSKPNSIENPCGTLTVNPKYNLVTCKRFIMNQYTNGGQHSDINNPSPAILATPKQNLITVKHWIMNTNFNNVGSSIDEPSQVITANRKWHYLMNPQFYNQVKSVNETCFTLIARMDKMPPYLVTAENGNMSIRIDEKDSEYTRKIKEFMTIYGIVDIKMRMLKISELKLIMGFPKDYTLIGTQAEQKKFIGNAVEVNTSTALCECLALAIYNYKYKMAI